MKWMTLRQIKAAAAKGPLAALDNSIEKYEQTLQAEAGELRAKLERHRDKLWEACDYIERPFCACCMEAGNVCSDCIIGEYSGFDCDRLGHIDVMYVAETFIHGGPVTPLRKALRVMISNMKKARKAYIKDNKGKVE